MELGGVVAAAESMPLPSALAAAVICNDMTVSNNSNQDSKQPKSYGNNMPQPNHDNYQCTQKK
jgi:hypothetical protein